MPNVNGQVVGSPALHASSSISSFAPAATMLGSIGLTATAGSFCLFCEKGEGGLATVTSGSLAGVAPATAPKRSAAAAKSRAASTSRFILSPSSRNERILDRSRAIGVPCGAPTLAPMATLSSTPVRLDRGYVRVSGHDAADFLERMVSNEVV